MTKTEIKREVKQAMKENGYKVFLKDIELLEYSTSRSELGNIYVSYVMFEDMATGKEYQCYYGHYNPNYDTLWLIEEYECSKGFEVAEQEEKAEVKEVTEFAEVEVIEKILEDRETVIKNMSEKFTKEELAELVVDLLSGRIKVTESNTLGNGLVTESNTLGNGLVTESNILGNSLLTDNEKYDEVFNESNIANNYNIYMRYLNIVLIYYKSNNLSLNELCELSSRLKTKFVDKMVDSVYNDILSYSLYLDYREKVSQIFLKTYEQAKQLQETKSRYNELLSLLSRGAI